MTIEQYNAYCAGFRYKCADDLVNQITAAYYNAYWNGMSKSKKSLNTIIKKIYTDLNKEVLHKKAPKINKEAVKKDFERMEALRKNGWWQD